MPVCYGRPEPSAFSALGPTTLPHDILQTFGHVRGVNLNAGVMRRVWEFMSVVGEIMEPCQVKGRNYILAWSKGTASIMPGRRQAPQQTVELLLMIHKTWALAEACSEGTCGRL